MGWGRKCRSSLFERLSLVSSNHCWQGQQVNLPAPKSHFAKDVTFEGDTSIFCTTTRPLTYVKNGCLDYRETEVMNVRWKVLLDEPNSTKPTARFGSVFIVLCATNFTSRRLLNYLYLIIRVTLRNEHTR